jgi:hypothetical protein
MERIRAIDAAVSEPVVDHLAPAGRRGTRRCNDDEQREEGSHRHKTECASDRPVAGDGERQGGRSLSRTVDAGMSGS